MATLQWNANNLLEAVDKNGDHLFLWTYSTFEKYNREAITPSMYDFMAGFVEANFPGADLTELAVDAYYEVPINERIDMHHQMLENLEAELKRAKVKLEALEGECPFDPKSPIYVEYMEWCNEQKKKWRVEVDNIEQDIHEEEQWRGGHEDGASETGGPLYDHMDEY
jgi:hypothetical protein